MKGVLAILLALATTNSWAAELAAVRVDNHLGARLQGTSLPESFGRDLTSGLTSRLMIRLTLHQAARELRARSVEIAIRYDLWDETFTLTRTLDGISLDTATYREAQQVIRELQQITFSELFPTSGLPADVELVMRAVVLLNPIDRERLEEIRKWVAKNNKRSTLDPAGALGVGDASVSSAIMERIFEQYTSGADAAAVWQQTLTTEPFRLGSVPLESR
ncbi:hypothetical protein [Steroidobacter agaridevorans]|uniref:hypothetical protein n=1 Tax=Steroidobacter agaridevorans TaxID=2695856 RepID=UPI001329193B|nr:hypothetical protein [Steroidobacter agaridevorans]GFE91577.1 hypothetical protein GCM10011488_65310 [Steroidobacter agaridevorans]